MTVAMVEACARADATVPTVSTVVKVSGSNLSQIGPAQFEQSAGQPKNAVTTSVIKLIYFHND